MSTNYCAAGSARWPVLPVASRRGSAADWASSRPAAIALLRPRQLLEAFAGAWWKRCPANGEPPTPPEDQPTSASIWDDPALWMLMMH